LKFWDSSALVPLFVEEELSAAVRAAYLEEDAVLTWWGTRVECASAIARLEREDCLTTAEATDALDRLRTLAAGWYEIDPVETIREIAERLLRVHLLRAADALQLAAAHVGCEGRPSTLDVVCLDERLAIAAQREGFSLIDPSRP
jgi:predicted nucleic acid-binding protein